MSEQHPRSLRMKNGLWNTLGKLAKIGKMSNNQLAVNMLQAYCDILTQGLDINKEADQNTIKKLLERFEVK